MTRTGDKFNLFKIVLFAFCVITMVSFHKLAHLAFIIFTHKLSDYFFSNVTTDIFVIIALASNFFLLYFFENMKPSRLLSNFFFFSNLMKRTMSINNYIVFQRLRSHFPNQRTLRYLVVMR